jgi:hypothetical protein
MAENETPGITTEPVPPADQAAQTPIRQRKVFYGDLEIPIPHGATREHIREVMLRTYPELSNCSSSGSGAT